MTYTLVKRVIKVRFISLVNLIMDREVVRELIQNDLNQVTLHSELQDIIVTGYKHEIIRRDYNDLRTILGGGGASSRVAEDIVSRLKEPVAG